MTIQSVRLLCVVNTPTTPVKRVLPPSAEKVFFYETRYLVFNTIPKLTLYNFHCGILSVRRQKKFQHSAPTSQSLRRDCRPENPPQLTHCASQVDDVTGANGSEKKVQSAHLTIADPAFRMACSTILPPRRRRLSASVPNLHYSAWYFHPLSNICCGLAIVE